MRAAFTVLFFACLGFTACKKTSRTCTCTSTCNSDTVKVRYEFRSREKDAAESCRAYAVQSGGCIQDCVLK